MGITINTEPIDVTIDGTTINFQGDPLPSPEWDTLMEVEWTYTTSEGREKAKTELTDALAALTHSAEDADLFRKLDLGVITMRKVAHGYMEAVTGFPTKPPAGSTGRSKKTGGT